jgi:hypothetical protein
MRQSDVLDSRTFAENALVTVATTLPVELFKDSRYSLAVGPENIPGTELPKKKYGSVTAPPCRLSQSGVHIDRAQEVIFIFLTVSYG